MSRRKYMVNEVSKRKKDLVGLLPVVIFRPEDMELMDGSPSLRRTFLDRAISQVDVEYARSLVAYEQAQVYGQ